MSALPLIDRLAAHHTVGGVPREQLQWLVDNGTVRTFQPGAVLSTSGEPVAGLYVILDGHFSIRVDGGAGPRLVMEWHTGDVTGLLPYSRLKSPPGTVYAEAVSEVLMVDRAMLRRMTIDCYELTAVMVHVMLDRVRVFKSSELLDEKMASLGRLAAGLAHELNNPASAVTRSAKALRQQLDELERATKAFCQLNLSDDACQSIIDIRDGHAMMKTTTSSLQLADREDALAEWLDDRGIEHVDLAPLAAAAFTRDDLDALHDVVGDTGIVPVLAHLSAGQNTRRLTNEIYTAASRIHALVAAVKGFTYMDQQATLQPIDLRKGIEDTVTVLGSKARSKNVSIEVDIDPSLPAVSGYGGELNQVWANLLDNAIDAAPNGVVRIYANVPIDHVVVRIIDNGSGIPESVVARIFDPFFTTKPVGEGTGLGLDIARRIVNRHRGSIDLHTGANGTEFRVTLPVSDAPR